MHKSQVAFTRKYGNLKKLNWFNEIKKIQIKYLGKRYLGDQAFLHLNKESSGFTLPLPPISHNPPECIYVFGRAKTSDEPSARKTVMQNYALSSSINCFFYFETFYFRLLFKLKLWNWNEMFHRREDNRKTARIDFVHLFPNLDFT